MIELFWTPLSVNLFVEAFLIYLIAVYFGGRLANSLKTGVDRRNSALLFVTFFMSGLAISFNFLAQSLPVHLIDHALPWVSPFAAASMSAFVLFSYPFEGKWVPPRWCGVALIVLFAGIVGFETVVAIWRVQQLGLGIVEYRDAWTDVPFVLGFVVAQALFYVRLVAALAEERNAGMRQAAFQACIAILKPAAPLFREAATARAFFYSTFWPLIIALVLLARSHGLIEWYVAEVVTCWLSMAIFAGFALIYLNYVPEYSSFIVKLVGLSLTAILCILSGLSWVTGSVYADAFISPQPLASRTALRFEPAPDGAYKVGHISFDFDAEPGKRITDHNEPVPIGFSLPFFGRSYSTLFPHQAGMIGLESFPRWQDIQHIYGPQPAIFVVTADLVSAGAPDAPARSSGMFYKNDENHMVVTWNKLVSKYAAEDQYTFQLKLFPSGVIEMHYAELPERPMADYYLTGTAPMMTGIVPPYAGREIAQLRFASDLPFVANPGEGIVDYRRTEFRRYLNQVYEPIALFILVSSLVILIVFPQIFKINIDRPLKELIRGVGAFRTGKLSTDIRVYYRDEIGFLTSTFNEMAAAQNELQETLEKKVAERTAIASRYAAENARLEERNHLSQELHDAVSQSLFSANLIADTLPALVSDDPERGWVALADMRQMNREALLEMRQLLSAIRYHKIADLPLGHSLQDLVGNAERQNSVKITLEIDGDLILPEHVQLAFFRIAQESVANALKHSGAQDIQVYFDAVDDQAILAISDNGNGFEQARKRPGHFGMEIMQERMSSIGGTLEIETGPGRGTIITALWGTVNDR